LLATTTLDAVTECIATNRRLNLWVIQTLPERVVNLCDGTRTHIIGLNTSSGRAVRTPVGTRNPLPEITRARHMSRENDLALVREYTKSESLIRHMLAVEAAVRAYARHFGEDEEKWGCVGLLHDFDYERWPDPPDHPLKGSEILRERGYPDDVIYAIKSHADYLEDCPRVSQLDKTLYACDELCGFITACAMVRPTRLEGLKARSVRKKMKQASFAAAVNRDDIVNGAADLGVDLNEHIDFCIAAMQPIAAELGLSPDDQG
jgi:putative nucleotidyltransferase with HDIG domain